MGDFVEKYDKQSKEITLIDNGGKQGNLEGKVMKFIDKYIYLLRS